LFVFSWNLENHQTSGFQVIFATSQRDATRLRQVGAERNAKLIVEQRLQRRFQVGFRRPSSYKLVYPI
jgi:hypothetical protein